MTTIYHKRARELKALGFVYDKQWNRFRRGRFTIPKGRVLTAAADSHSWALFIEAVKENQ